MYNKSRECLLMHCVSKSSAKRNQATVHPVYKMELFTPVLAKPSALRHQSITTRDTNAISILHNIYIS